ncbi:MAG: SDR family oxidoreductase [Vicingaceae bacterium]
MAIDNTIYTKKYHDNDLSQFTFLVTGGAGFIGSNLVEYLLVHGAKKVVVFDNLSNGYQENVDLFKDYKNYQFIKGDLTDFTAVSKALKGVDYVFHQAALGSVPRSIENPIATHNANATGTLNLFTAAKDASIKKLVFASSSSVYGSSQKSPKIEEEIGDPLSPYAVSKRTKELYAKVFSDLYGLPVVGLRYFNIFGPRQNPNNPYAAAIPLFINALLNNQSPKIFGDGLQSRDFTFVENAVQANIKAVFSGDFTNGKIYNIAYGQNISVIELIEKIKSILNSNLQPEYLPERIGDVRNSLAAVNKAKNDFGYEPSVDLETGLKHTINWLKNN